MASVNDHSFDLFEWIERVRGWLARPLIQLAVAALLTAILLLAELTAFRTFLEFELLARILAFPLPYAIAEKVVFFPLLSFIFFCILIRQETDHPHFLKLSLSNLLLQISGAGVYFTYCFFLTRRLHLAEAYSVPLTLLFYLLGVAFFISIFFVFFKPKELFASFASHKDKIGFALLFTTIFFISKPLFQRSWEGLSYSVASLVSLLLRISYDGVSFTPQDYGLAVGGFRVDIYEPCSGVEGITLFIFVYLSYLMVDWSMVRKWRALCAGLLGILIMYGANVLRIYLIMVLGFEVFERMGAAAAYTLVVRYFHGHIGWFLYGAIILLYVALSRPFIMGRNPSKSHA